MTDHTPTNNLRAACKRAGCGRRAIMSAIDRGDLAAVFVGGSVGWLIQPEAVDEWIRQDRVRRIRAAAAAYHAPRAKST